MLILNLLLEGMTIRGCYKNCSKLRLLTWTSLFGQFVHPVGKEGMGKGIYFSQLRVSLD